MEWYLVGNFKNALVILKEYYDSYLDKLGLLYWLGVWIRAMEEDWFIEDYVDDDRLIVNV
jgi:hypothetical protein